MSNDLVTITSIEDKRNYTFRPIKLVRALIDIEDSCKKNDILPVLIIGKSMNNIQDKYLLATANKLGLFDETADKFEDYKEEEKETGE